MKKTLKLMAALFVGAKSGNYEIGKLSNSARVFFLVESTRFCIKKKSCQLLLSEIGKLYRLMGFADNFSYGERTL